MKYLTILLFTAFTACQNAPTPIVYGSQPCASCRMTIVDSRFGCQLYTSKGKTFSFDAIECLQQFQHEHPETQSASCYFSDYNHPGVVLSAEEAILIHSEIIPSPMGGHLGAISKSQYSPSELVELFGESILESSNFNTNNDEHHEE